LGFSDGDDESSVRSGEPDVVHSAPPRLILPKPPRPNKTFWRSMTCRVGPSAAMHAEPTMNVSASADPALASRLPVARPLRPAASLVLDAEPVSPGSRIPLPPSLLPVMPLTRSGPSKAL
jgi:hypothetical protein